MYSMLVFLIVLVTFVQMRFFALTGVVVLLSLSACTGKSEVDGTNTQATLSEAVDTNWVEVGGGVKLRKNAGLQKQLEGRIFARNYDQAISENMKNSIQYSMGLCRDGKMTTHEKTIAMTTDDKQKETPKEVFDEGDWQAMEDQKGNLYIRINMKKSGKGFLNFEIKGKDLVLKNGENAEVFAEQAGGC